MDLVREHKDKGQIRRFTGNDYIDDVASGNIAIAQAYSGDVVQMQADNPDIEFVVPESGGTTFVDTMVIPYTTKNQKAAEAWINYIYDRRQLREADRVHPVRAGAVGLTDELTKVDPDAGKQPPDQPATRGRSPSRSRGRR